MMPGSISLPGPLPEPESRLVVKSVSGVLYRLHHPDYLYRDEFWKTFLDCDRKWAQQARFAGENMNCGHYFAFTPEGCRAEDAFYEGHKSKGKVLLQVKATLPAVVDLTHPACMRYAMGIYASDPDEIKNSRIYRVMTFLADEMSAGNDFTDLIGHWAGARRRYDGILFFSARSLAPHQRRLLNTPDHMFELDEACGFTQDEMVEADMQTDPALQNLVAFSGARLTAAIEEFRVDDEPWRRNPWHGFSEQALDEVLRTHGVPFDSSYQEERRCSLSIRQGPGEPVEPWRPGKPGPHRPKT